MSVHEAQSAFRRSLAVTASEVGASIAIGVIWLAVMFSAIFGPDIVNTSAGGDSSTVPSAVIVALFAFLATWVIARRAFPANRR